MATTIGFIKRSPNDLLNKIIYQLRVKVSLFNVKIQLANGASLEAHAIVLAMYSKYFRLLLGASAPDAKFIGKLFVQNFIIYDARNVPFFFLMNHVHHINQNNPPLKDIRYTILSISVN